MATKINIKLRRTVVETIICIYKHGRVGCDRWRESRVSKLEVKSGTVLQCLPGSTFDREIPLSRLHYNHTNPLPCMSMSINAFYLPTYCWNLLIFYNKLPSHMHIYCVATAPYSICTRSANYSCPYTTVYTYTRDFIFSLFEKFA